MANQLDLVLCLSQRKETQPESNSIDILGLLMLFDVLILCEMIEVRSQTWTSNEM